MRRWVMPVRAVLFDFSGTLFRLEEDDSWFAGMSVAGGPVDEHVQAELMERLTHPTGRMAGMSERAYRAWLDRDLAPSLQVFQETKAKAIFVDVGRDGVSNLAVTGLELGEPVAPNQA